MFYRRKIIFALLQVFGGRLEKINLQKLLFLVCQKQEEPSYDFIPYKYGCYSHSAKADLVTMVKKNFLVEDEKGYQKKDQKNYFPELKETDQKIIREVFRLYEKMDSEGLMKHTYTQFPYYAINSTVADQLLTKEQLQEVIDSRPSINKTVLYTIGYEGVSLETYLNKLLISGVKVLVDVRNNPMSQKFGFSRSQLIKYCESLDIEYVHIPEVGIQSEYRQELVQQADYDNLFKAYRVKTLPKTISSQEKILSLLIEKRRIALTCFEANICQCHRKHLAEAIIKLPGWNFELKHL